MLATFARISKRSPSSLQKAHKSLALQSPRGRASHRRTVGACRSFMADILFGCIPCSTGSDCSKRPVALLVKLMETGGQCLFGFGFAMHDTYLGRPLAHPRR